MYSTINCFDRCTCNDKLKIFDFYQALRLIHDDWDGCFIPTAPMNYQQDTRRSPIDDSPSNAKLQSKLKHRRFYVKSLNS